VIDLSTPARVRALVHEGERLTGEFKGEERRPLSDDLVEAVVYMANRAEEAAGWLLVGVEDDGRVTGARPRHDGGMINSLMRRPGHASNVSSREG